MLNIILFLRDPFGQETLALLFHVKLSTNSKFSHFFVLNGSEVIWH